VEAREAQSVTEPLPELLDEPTTVYIARRGRYVRRADVEAFIEANTHPPRTGR
jgi:hypothetical protein